MEPPSNADITSEFQTLRTLVGTPVCEHDHEDKDKKDDDGNDDGNDDDDSPVSMDSYTKSGRSSPKKREVFHRVDLRFNSTPPVSLLTVNRRAEADHIKANSSPHTQQQVPSPSINRREMLANELTELLRKSLLRERDCQNRGNLFITKQRHLAVNFSNISGPMPMQSCQDSSNNFNYYFEDGLKDYHSRGW